MTLDTALKAVEVLLNVLVLAVGAGIGIGQLKARLRAPAVANGNGHELHGRSTPAPNGNGQAAAIMFLTERVTDLERERALYMRVDLSDEKFTGVWHEMKNLRGTIEAVRRRVEGMAGQG